MLESRDYGRVADAFPSLKLPGSELGADFVRKASLIRVPAGRDLMATGDRAEAIPLLISGQIRVYTLGESGREITLYRFNRGECCVLTADSIIGRHQFPANAQVEEDSELALVPDAVFDDWLARHAGWREFVFQAMAHRLGSLLTTLEDVAFRRMDLRVAALLLGRAAESGDPIAITHQEIANELGSSREVISRILEDFRARGLVQLARGAIVIADRRRLEAATRV
jgi:CRP/FNR family transcriptional regulator, anaerobic regulatory protein